MNKFSILLFLCIPPALANETKLFDADPICDSVVDFKKELDQARPIHLTSPLLRTSVSDQDKWFKAVTNEMSAACAAEKKFAASLLAKKRGNLTGQCKPAEEAASYDQEMLEHSEKNLKQLQSTKEKFLSKGVRGVTDSLHVISDRNIDLIDDLAGDLHQVDLKAYCELHWLFPADVLTKLHVGSVEGCPALEKYNRPEAQDKKDPSLFSKLLRRFDLSIDYNKARREKAATVAADSLKKYEKCVAENPGLKPSPLLGKKNIIKGQGGVVPSGASPRGSSDITGTEEDKNKKK